jgi:hypothetical protein
VIAALALSAGSASADVGWHFGDLQQTWINDCYTADVVHGVGEYAGAHYDADAPPKTGDVFYVNVVMNGVDASCAEYSMPDIQLPAGMAPAISAANPILCYTVDNSSATETPETTDCPSALGAPLNGGTGSIRDPNGQAPGLWDTRAPKAWEVRIPVTAGAAGMQTIAFPTNVISGSITQPLDPTVDVPIAQGPVVPPPPPPPPPHNTLTLTAAARSAKFSRGRILSFTVTPSENGSATATGTISIPKGAKVVRFGKRRVTLRAGKPAKVALKLSKKNAAAVRRALRHRSLTAHVVLAAKGASGDTSTTALRIKLKR